MDRDTLYGAGCFALGAALVIVQLVAFLQASKERTSSDVRKRAVHAAQAAGAAADSAHAASVAAQHAAQRASELQSVTGLGNEALSAVQHQFDAALAATETAKATAKDAKQQAEEAEEAAKGATVNDLLTSIAGKMPLAVLGFLFVVLGAMAMGLVDISFGAAAGNG